MSQYRMANWQNEGSPRESNNRSLRLMLASAAASRIALGDQILVPEINILRPRSPPHNQDTTTHNIVPINDHHTNNVGTVFRRESSAPLGTNTTWISNSSSSAAQRFPTTAPRLFGSSLLPYHRSGHDNDDNNSATNDHRSGVETHSPEELRVGNIDLSLGGSSNSSSPHLNNNNNAMNNEDGDDDGDGDDGDGTRRLSFKRRSSPEQHSFRSEYAIGESSSTGGTRAGGNPRQRVAGTPFQDNAANYDMNANRSITTLSGIGNSSGTRGVSNNNVQHLNEAARPQTYNFENYYASLHAAANNAQSSVPPNMRFDDSPVPFPSTQQQLYPANYSAHPIEDNVPDHFLEAPPSPPWSWSTNMNMRPTNAPPASASLPLYPITGANELVPPNSHNPRNNNNFMLRLSPEFGMGNWAHTGNIDFASFFQDASNSSNVEPSNASSPWIQNVNINQYNVRILPQRTGSNVNPSSPPNSNTYRSSQVQDIIAQLENAISQNQLRYENQLPRGNLDRIMTSTSPEARIERIRLRDQITRALSHLRSGGSLRVEDLLILDYSIVLNLLDMQENMEGLISQNSENWQYEMLLALEEQMGYAETGLSEEEIMTHIGHEVFHSFLDPQHETCCICQEEYINGEEIGRLDCGHIFHMVCIKQWLVLKNICPICKQTALAVEEEGESNE